MTLNEFKQALGLRTEKHDQFLALGLLTLATTAPMGTSEAEFNRRAIQWALSHDDIYDSVQAEKG